MANGGKRIGAGRKPGASFAQLVTLAEKKKFTEFVLKKYPTDTRLAVWVGNQLFGQAPQAIDLTSGNEPLQPILVKFLDGKDHRDTRGV